MPKDVLDPEVLKEQESLSDEQRDEIRDRSYADAKKREKEARDEEEDEEDPFEAPLDRKDKRPRADEEEDEGEVEDDETPEEKQAREAEEAKAKEEAEKAEAEKAAAEKAQKVEAARKKEEKDLTDEDRELIRADDEVLAKAREKEIDEYVSVYSEKFGLTEAQARKDAEKVYGVMDKYKGQPREMAQALYHLNTKLAQTATELSAIKNAPKGKELIVKDKAGQQKKLTEQETRDFLIPKYREHYKDQIPGLDEMSDDAVFALAWQKTEEQQRAVRAAYERNLKAMAEEKRREILQNISEQDKVFLKDIRGAIERAGDQEVLAEDFDVSDYVYWARGKNYHKDLKAAVEKAKEEALKEKKILGAENGGGGKGGGTPPKKGGAARLTEAEKKEALDMFERQDVSDDQKFKLFMEVKAHREAVNKKKRD